MSNEPTVKWLEQNDQDMRLADTGLNARSDFTGLRLSSGLNSANHAEEQAAIQQSLREMEKGSGGGKENRNGAMFESDFKAKHGITFRADPPDSLAFEYGADGAVIIRVMTSGEGVGDAVAAPTPQHPLQLYKATVSGDVVVRVRYGSVWGMVPEEVDGGGAPASFTPSDGLKVWAEVTVDADGLPVDSAIASGDEVPADTDTTGHFLIGQVAVSGSAVTLYQSVTHSINGQTCGALVYNWWAV